MSIAEQFGLLAVPTGDSSIGGVPTNVAVSPLVAMTAPFPVIESEEVVFHATHPSLSMHREDGKRISFHNGYYFSTQAHDTRYLDEQIAAGVPGIRRATPDEVKQAKFLANPLKATAEAAEAKAKAEMAATFQQELERAREMMQKEFQEKLRQSLREAGINAGTGGKDVDSDDPSKSASKAEAEQAAPVETPAVRVDRVPLSASKLGAASTASLGGGAAPSNSR